MPKKSLIRQRSCSKNYSRATDCFCTSVALTGLLLSRSDALKFTFSLPWNCSRTFTKAAYRTYLHASFMPTFALSSQERNTYFFNAQSRLTAPKKLQFASFLDFTGPIFYFGRSNRLKNHLLAYTAAIHSL